MDFLSLIPDIVGGALWKVFAFILAISIIVFVHEYGHYIVARWTGIKAEVFSLGFGPVLASRRDRRGTLWQICALPLGGFVRFSGDEDAASSPNHGAIKELSSAQRRQTMHGAPLWARSATVAAGPAANFILAILIFIGSSFWVGVVTNSAIVAEVRDLPFTGAHLRAGDEILRLGDTPVSDMTDLSRAARALPPSETVPYVVRRDGREVVFDGPHPLAPIVASVAPQTAAYEGGVRPGDVVLKVNGTKIETFDQLRAIVGASKGAPLTLDMWRAGTGFQTVLTPRRTDLPLPQGGFETRWLLGITGGLAIEPSTRNPNIIEAFSYSVDRVGFIIRSSLSGLWGMVTGALSSCNLQGPLGIAENSAAAASLGANNFLFFIGVLSVAIGMMNLFPIPVLDGGHLLFFAYEAVTGKPPAERALRVMMTAGFSLLIVIMTFSLSNDIFCP